MTVRIDSSINDDWASNYLHFLSDEKLLALRRERAYPLMNEDRQKLIDPIRNISLNLLQVVQVYAEIRNFLDMTTNRLAETMKWLEKYGDLVPKVDPNEQDLAMLEKYGNEVLDIEEFKNSFPLIPDEDLDIFAAALSEIHNLVRGLIPFYKAFPHASSGISDFIFDTPREYTLMLSNIVSNFKNGRYTEVKDDNAGAEA